MQLLVREVTEKMNEYKLAEASRPIVDFITELSQWYVRRSRDRFKIGDTEDKAGATITLRVVLLTLSKVMAPFTPFIAEKIYQELGGDKESVHLEEWPEVEDKMIDEQTISDMAIARKIVEMGLSLRVESGIKVKQPLSKLTINHKQLTSEFLNIIADELNIRMVESAAEVVSGEYLIVKEDSGLKMALNIEITEELKKAGLSREIIRAINQLRKEKNLAIDNKSIVQYETSDELLRQIFVEYKDELMKHTASSDIRQGFGDKEIVIDEKIFKLGVEES